MMSNDLPEPEQRSEDPRVHVIINDDKEKVFIILTEPPDRGEDDPPIEPVTGRQILDVLQESGVVHGIDVEAINAIVMDSQYNRRELVAAATPPVDGKDGSLEFHFPRTSEHKPKVMPDGSVDFKQLDIVKNVREDEVLCTVTPPTEGEPGTDVMGDPIKAYPGKEVALPIGQNTKASEDGLQLLAKISGQVDFISHQVSVMNVFNIKGNVDYNTGNIDFVGNVMISGDVCAGFSVRAEGNVTINGIVDGGTVEAGGSITVANGINGQSSGKVTCGGDLRCKFLQNANIDVEQNLETTSCVGSTVQVGESAKFVGSKTMILGSHVIAGQSVEVFNIGSKTSTVKSIIEVGTNPRIASRLAEIPGQISQINSNIEGLNRIVTLFQQLEEQGRLSDDKKTELVNLLATVKNSEQDLLRLSAEKEELEKKAESLGYGTVKVLGAAHHGTQIIIGSEKKMLDTDYPFTKFIRTGEGIIASSAQ